MGVLNILKKVLPGNRKREVADEDSAPHDSLYGKNVKLENARREARKISEKLELERLQRYIKADREKQRAKRWTDHGGFIKQTPNGYRRRFI